MNVTCGRCGNQLPHADVFCDHCIRNAERDRGYCACAEYAVRGDIVLDPFAGSGSTLVACEELGMRGRGVELDPRYAASTIERFDGMGITPKRVVSGAGS